jgi:ABC-2 type transport system permease protein
VASLRDTPLAAFAELRFLLAWRRLRARGGAAELVAQVVGYLMVIPAALIFSGLVAAGTWRAARAGRGLQSSLPVSALFFGVWQAWTATALSLQDGEQVDLRRFLVYPLRAGRLYAYGLVATVVGDPFALFWCALLLGGFAGAALGRFGAWLLPFALGLALFVAATAAWVALLQETAGRLLRGRRRVRLLLVALVYLGVVFASLALAGQRRPVALGRVTEVLEVVQWIAWPAALAAGAARRLFAGEVAAALPWLAGLAVAGAAAAWSAFRLALAAARSGGEALAARGAGPGAGWATEALPGRVGPLVEREAKHLLRHPLPGVLALVIPALAGIVAWKALPHIPAEAGEVVRALPLLGFALYTHLATQVFWLNAFAWDRGGARLLFLAPLDLADVLQAKNAATYALSAALYLAATGLTVLVAGAPPLWALAAAAALHGGVAPFLYGLGNLVSVLNPRISAMTLQRSGALPALSGLAGMAIVSGVSALFAAPVLLALRIDSGWVLPAAWLALGAGGLLAYRATLPRVARLLAARREPLLAAVTGDDQ